MDFAIGLVNSVLNLPNGQMKFFEEFKLQKNCEINVLIKTFLGLVEMMFGLVNVSFSLPKWQAVKMTFFAPCQQYQTDGCRQNLDWTRLDQLCNPSLYVCHLMSYRVDQV